MKFIKEYAKMQLIKIFLVVVAVLVVVVCIYLIGDYSVNAAAYAKAYTQYVEKSQVSKAAFKQEFITMELEKQAGETESEGDIEKFDSLEGVPVELIPASEDVVVNSWLMLRAQPSYSGGIKDTNHKGVSLYKAEKWAMGEGSSLEANKYMRALYEDQTARRPKINGKVATQGSVNGSGRYWVAIGPSWFNKAKIVNGYYEGKAQSLTASQWFSDGKGHEFDVMVKYQGKIYYIPCVMGDAKAHTAGDGKGYIQSGYGFDGTDYSVKHRDRSIVEFVGVEGSAGASLGSLMEFVGIIKY